MACTARHCDDARVRLERLCSSDNLQSIDVRQDEVSEDDVEAPRPKLRDRVFAIRHRGDIVRRSLEDRCKNISRGIVIVDEQDGKGFHW